MKTLAARRLLLAFFVAFCAQTIVCQAASTLVFEECKIATLRPDALRAVGSQFDALPFGYHLYWSQNMRRVAYWATKDKGLFAVVDDAIGQAYDLPKVANPRGEIEPPPILFSPDEKHFAYLAQSGTKHFVVRDGKAGAAYDWIAPDDLHFSDDNQRIAYLARRGKKNLMVVHDGNKISEFSYLPPKSLGGFLISTSNDPSLYKIVERDGKKVLIFHGTQSLPYDAIYDKSPFFNKGRFPPPHFALRAERDGKMRLLVDGIEIEQSYDAAPGLVLPPLIFPDYEGFFTLMKRGDEIWRVEVKFQRNFAE